MGSKRMKGILIWLLAAVMVFSFTALAAGCAPSGSAAATEADWSITVKDSSGKSVEFTNADAGKIKMVEVDAVLVKKDGSEVNQTWKGIQLSEVLKSTGISGYNMVAVEASDGYRQEYEASAVNDPGTILGFFLDGEEVSVEDGLVQLVVPSLSGKFWIKNVAMIEVMN